MSYSIKQIFKNHLTQLSIIVRKIPEDLFETALSDDMFSLEMNAKIAANFILRGYCPLVDQEVISLMQENSGKAAVTQQIDATLKVLEGLTEVTSFDDSKILKDKAGFAEIELKQSLFIHQYIIPNLLFHMSMVYAIARKQGVALSKGDFDGLHSYPGGFKFV